MACPFSILNLSRRPFLSDEEIGSAYRKLAGELHPDQAGGDTIRFRELGEAAAILSDPSRRLRTLAGQNAPRTPCSLPSHAADLFPKIAAILQQADSLREKKESASNALAKALLAAPLKTVEGDLTLTLSQLEVWRASLEQELREMDHAWPKHDPDKMNLLADSFAYATRWETQLRERKLALEATLD